MDWERRFLTARNGHFPYGRPSRDSPMPNAAFLRVLGGKSSHPILFRVPRGKKNKAINAYHPYCQLLYLRKKKKLDSLGFILKKKSGRKNTFFLVLIRKNPSYSILGYVFNCTIQPTKLVKRTKVSIPATSRAQLFCNASRWSLIPFII